MVIAQARGPLSPRCFDEGHGEHDNGDQFSARGWKDEGEVSFRNDERGVVALQVGSVGVTERVGNATRSVSLDLDAPHHITPTIIRPVTTKTLLNP